MLPHLLPLELEINEAGKKCFELYIVVEHHVVPLNCARGREHKSHSHLLGGKPHQQCCPLAGGPMPVTVGPHPALNLLCEQHPHLTAGPLCHLPTAGLGARAQLCNPLLLFIWGPPSSVGPRHMAGQHGRRDPCWGTMGQGEILTVAAVSRGTWRGPWLGVARWHDGAQHSL